MALLDPGLLTALVLFACLAVATLSLDVVRTTYGIKSDESSYVAMALSVGYDGDLAFQRSDLTRFWSIYQSGPEGIFLKRGRTVDVGVDLRWPFVHVGGAPDTRDDRLYFGKAFIYPLVAAPFVRAAGLNGMLFLHVLLLAGVFAVGYLFLVERASQLVALLVTGGFLAASITPIYAVFLMPEIFNFSVVFYACFFWLYKEVREGTAEGSVRVLYGDASDVVAAILLGLATFSKPVTLLLVLPIVALAWWRRRLWHGLKVGLVFSAVVAGCFGANAIITGELNYQGGDRKTFYGRFPFDAGESDFENLGVSVTTNELDVGEDDPAFWPQLGHNLTYFMVGRHFGLMAYYFPGLVIIGWAWWCRRSLEVWHAMIAVAVGVTSLALLVLLPNTWSGGGGPPGNRYFLSIYPALFFLTPPGRSVVPGLIIWAGGMLFTAAILVDPFVAAKRPWHNTEQGVVRSLPVELTMVNDLPVRLNQGRSRIRYGREPSLMLYYLDENASRPVNSEIWVAGRARADIIVRTGVPLSELRVTLRAPIDNTVTVTADGTTETVHIQPGVATETRLPVRGVYARGGYSFVLTVRTSSGFVPHLRQPTSRDRRYLGVAVQFSGTPR